MDQMAHEIVIDNLHSEEVVEHSIIRIRGSTKDLQNNCQREEIFINNSPTLLVKNIFKALIELKVGENTIDLKYCCTNINFVLHYKPRETKLTVLPLYIICEGHNGNFQAPESEKNDVESACKRITLCSKLLQTVFAEKLFEDNLKRKTFRLEDDCKVFHSKLHYLDARRMSQENLWSSLGREIANSLGCEGNRKFLGFLSCTRYCGENYDEKTKDFTKLTEAYVALGGGGLALLGSACLYTWPEELCQVVTSFRNQSKIDRRKFLDDSCFRGTYGSCFSTTLGSVLHELSHTFDLGHTEVGIMGRGFDDLFKFFLPNDLKPKSFYKKMEDDGTFWTESCLTILGYHKWFNNFTNENEIKYDDSMKIVRSTSGLRVVEVRNEEDEMVLKYWVFPGRILKYSFQIPSLKIKGKFLLIVEDNLGNILRQIINYSTR